MPISKFIMWPCFIAPALIATPTYTNTASASVTCQWVGQYPPTEGFTKTYTASGTVDVKCPVSDPLYVGPSVNGGAGQLSAGVAQDGGYMLVLAKSSFDFKSTATDIITLPGSGPAQAVITLDLTWGAGNDLTAWEQDAADFWVNGVEVWSDVKYGYNVESPRFTTHQIVLAEPIELGVPFSYQADVEVTGGGNGFGYAKSALVIDNITDPPLPIPEPTPIELVTFGLVMAMLLRRGH